MTFHYIALSAEQKELSGVIEAADEQSARKKLNNLGLSIVSINQVDSFTQAAAAGDNKNVFEFEGIDKNSKRVTGTIKAITPIQAYARLTDEYLLSVLSLFKSTLAPAEKEEAKKMGVESLKKDYEKLYGGKKKKQKDEELVLARQQQERKELIEKVDETIQRIEKFLKDFEPDLKLEERSAIRSYIDQLLRIKDSTNLEHIRSTCERMLSHIQKQELFIHEGQRVRESSQVKVETEDMLKRLQQTGLQQEIDIVKTAMEWQHKPFLRPLASLILFFAQSQNPEVLILKNQIKEINRHVWLYIKMAITAKSPDIRKEAIQTVKGLFEERKRIKLQIKAIRDVEKKKNIVVAEPTYVWEQIGSALGFILAFYLIAYIISYPFTIKKFDLPIKIPDSFYFYNSGLIKGVTLFVFLAFGAVTARNLWLKKSWATYLVVYPLTIFVFLLIVINLV